MRAGFGAERHRLPEIDEAREAGDAIERGRDLANDAADAHHRHVAAGKRNIAAQAIEAAHVRRRNCVPERRCELKVGSARRRHEVSPSVLIASCAVESDVSIAELAASNARVTAISREISMTGLTFDSSDKALNNAVGGKVENFGRRAGRHAQPEFSKRSSVDRRIDAEETDRAELLRRSA